MDIIYLCILGSLLFFIIFVVLLPIEQENAYRRRIVMTKNILI